MEALERVRSEIANRNQALHSQLEADPELRSMISSMPDGERRKFRQKSLEHYAQDDRYRAGTLLETSGFMGAVNQFGEKFGIRDDELESVMQSFVESADKFKADDKVSKLDRLKQNFKDASLGITDVGSVGGFIYDEGKFSLGRISKDTQAKAASIEQAKMVREMRGKALAGDSQAKTALGYLPFNDLSTEALNDTITSMEQDVVRLNGEARENSLKLLHTLATRHGEYASLPEWKGVAEGSTALVGQLLGAIASPENLLPIGGGPVAGGLAKRIGTQAAKQAGENVAANALTEPMVQQKRIAEGMQDDYSLKGALVRSGLAFVIGGGVGTVKGAVSKPKVEAPTVEVPKMETPQPESTPIAKKQPKGEKPSVEQTTGKEVTSKFAERIAKDPRLNAEKILKDPNHKHHVQKLQADKDMLKELTDSQLEYLLDDNSLDSNLSILSGHVLRERLFTAGKDTTTVDRNLSKKLTTIGQLLRAAREIKSSPENLVQSIQKQVEKHGRKVPPHVEKQLKNLAERQERLRARLGKVRHAAEVSFTKKNKKAFLEAERALNNISVKLERKTNRLVPRGVWDSASGSVKGNLLVPKSIVVNVLGNTAFMPMRETSNIIGTAIDAVTPGKRTMANPVSLRSYGGRLVKGGQAFWDASKALFTNNSHTDHLKGDMQRGFQPFHSFAQAFATAEKSSLAVDAKTGKVRGSDRARAFVEGLLGLQAEPAFRLLRMGDDPFFAEAYYAELVNQAKLRKLEPGSLEWKQFLTLGDGDAKEKAKAAGQRATFSAENRAGSAINRFVNHDLGKHKVFGGPMKFLFTLQAPFVQFPINYVNAALPYVVPPFGIAKSVMKHAEGDHRAGHEAMGQALTGAILQAGAAWLWDNEMITPTVQYKNQRLKALQYQGNEEGIPSGSLNLSAFKRFMSGGSKEFQPGDDYVEFEKFGIPGMAMYLAAEKGMSKQRSTAEGADTSNYAMEMIRRFPDTTKFFTDQTFLAGTSAFLGALEDWDRNGSTFLTNTMQAASAVAVNNTTMQIAKARWEHIPELKVPGKPWQSFKNHMAYKTGFMDSGDVPVKIGLFGEKAKRTPDGSDPIVFNMLDPTNARKAKDNPRISYLWDAYRKTGNSAVLPDHPSDIVTFGNKTYRLTPKQHEKLKISAGKIRGNMLDNLKDRRFKDGLTIEEVLPTLYSTVNRTARTAFIATTGIQNLEEIRLHETIEFLADPFQSN